MIATIYVPETSTKEQLQALLASQVEDVYGNWMEFSYTQIPESEIKPEDLKYGFRNRNVEGYGYFPASTSEVQFLTCTEPGILYLPIKGAPGEWKDISWEDNDDAFLISHQNYIQNSYLGSEWLYGSEDVPTDKLGRFYLSSPDFVKGQKYRFDYVESDDLPCYEVFAKPKSLTNKFGH